MRQRTGEMNNLKIDKKETANFKDEINNPDYRSPCFPSKEQQIVNEIKSKQILQIIKHKYLAYGNISNSKISLTL